MFRFENQNYEFGDDNFEPVPSKSRKRASPNSDVYDESCQINVDNSDHILRTIKNLFVEQFNCDVTLKVGTKQHKAHRLILCASSDVFHSMLTRPEWCEWHESTVELQELPICENVFHVFLEYFYTGKIMITHTNVMPLLALADKYMVKSLSRICINYMCKHVPHAAHHNQLFSWLQYSTVCGIEGHNYLFETCQNYIKWNFEAVANTPDYSNFEPDMFVRILEQDDIVVYNEMALYNCAVRWLELQRIKMEGDRSEVLMQYKGLIKKIMRYIRFPMMKPQELANLVISPLIRELEQFFIDRMAIGMKYHAGYKEQIEEHLEDGEGRLLFSPRLYTMDSYSALLLIENFRSLPSYHTSTFVFSSHLSSADHESHKLNEWLVDLYPKGVCFKKCFLIVWQGTLEVPEEILSTVRLSLTCRELSESNMRVKISVLIYGMQSGAEHVMEVREKIHIFTEQDRVANIDDLLPFEDLNVPCIQGTKDTPYLVGPNRDQLKLNLVISPIR